MMRWAMAVVLLVSGCSGSEIPWDSEQPGTVDSHGGPTTEPAGSEGAGGKPDTTLPCATDADCPSAVAPCTVAACDPDLGACVLRPVKDGAPCDGGDPCWSASVCMGGACEGSMATSCDDGDPCTPDACSSLEGCVHGDAIVCDDGEGCTDDACSPVGGCAFTPNDASCDDGDACTTDDRCEAGGCTGQALQCDDGDPCTDDACGASGCESTGRAEGSVCGAAFGCEQPVCTAGACVVAPLDCDDGQPCTIDACNGDGGCTHALAGPGQTGCCATAADCDDGNPCTTETCGASGSCAYAAAPGSCSDGNACTLVDYCFGGQCLGTNGDCSDGDACTTDECNVVIGCLHAPVPDGAPCGDGAPCTTPTCQGGACAPGSATCDDGNPCTADACGEDGCTHEAVGPSVVGCCSADAHCKDDDPCTIDLCDDAQFVCSHEAQLGAYLTDSFDGPGLAGVVASSSSGAFGFGLSSKRRTSAPTSLYLGSSGTLSYDADGPLHATATLPSVALPANAKAVLGFWLWQDVEDKVCAFDTLRVIVNGEVVQKQCDSTNGWVPRTVDLAQWAGQTVSIAFDFDTVDGQANGGEGVYIDDVYLLDEVGSAGPCCESDADCAPATGCTNPGGVCLSL